MSVAFCRLGKLSAIISFFFKILFIYSTEIETASEKGNTSRGSGRGRSRLIVEEPDVGLARSHHARITARAEGRCLMTEPPGRPEKFFYFLKIFYLFI